MTKHSGFCRLGRAFGLVVALWVGIAATPSQAGVFNTYHFVPQGENAFGLEPELILTHGAGVGFNARFTHGLNDLNNISAIIGTGGGPRDFRFGINFTFDFFPDIKGQPGIGIAAQPLYYRNEDTGYLEVTAIPYIHKSFSRGGGSEIEPFFAFPFGMVFSDGNYHATSQAVVGSMFQSAASERIRYSAELGIAVNNAETYFSGGLTYYY